MIFTIISILICAFEYFLYSKFVYASSSIIISYCVESRDVVQMNYRDFLTNIVYKQWKIIGAMGKILKLRSEQIERLKPKLVTNGVLYVFVISVDIAEYNVIKRLMDDSVNNDDSQLRNVCMCPAPLPPHTSSHVLFGFDF